MRASPPPPQQEAGRLEERNVARVVFAAALSPAMNASNCVPLVRT